MKERQEAVLSPLVKLSPRQQSPKALLQPAKSLGAINFLPSPLLPKRPELRRIATAPHVVKRPESVKTMKLPPLSARGPPARALADFDDNNTS